jgi:hypothetical protein
MIPDDGTIFAGSWVSCWQKRDIKSWRFRLLARHDHVSSLTRQIASDQTLQDSQTACIRLIGIWQDPSRAG